MESIATGLSAGVHAAKTLRGDEAVAFPRETAIGSLCHYISHAESKRYQPANIAFDLFPPLPEPIQDRRERQIAVCDRALARLGEYMAAHV